MSLIISHNEVTLDGKVLTNLENAYQYPEDETMYLYRIWKNNGRILVLFRNRFFFVEFSIIIEQPFLRGIGLCGNLKDNPLNGVPTTIVTE